MNFGPETQKSFVDTWECDENGHLNIQFYWKRFGDAGQVFHLLMDQPHKPWIDRHVRYHKELHAGTNTVVHTNATADQEWLVHHLTDGENGNISATAVDRLIPGNADTAFPDGQIPDQIPDLAKARSLPTALLQPIDTRSVLEDGRGILSHRSMVEPQECDHDGNLLDQQYISRFSHAAPAFWQHSGATRGWMDEHNLGSVAVEMKATKHAAITAGTALEIISWQSQTGNKTLTFRHQVNEVATGKPLYSGAVTALLMDLTKRRAVSLPDFIRKSTKS